MSTNKISGSKIALQPKLVIAQNDPLKDVLRPETFVIADVNDFGSKQSLPDSAAEDGLDIVVDDTSAGDTVVDPYEQAIVPNLSDITLTSATINFGKNGLSDTITFKFNVKNNFGDKVVGAKVYGH